MLAVAGEVVVVRAMRKVSTSAAEVNRGELQVLVASRWSSGRKRVLLGGSCLCQAFLVEQLGKI